MKYFLILSVVVVVLAMLQVVSSDKVDCKKKCTKNRLACAWNLDKECYISYSDECVLYDAVCKKKQNLEKVIMTECSSAFDYCD